MIPSSPTIARIGASTSRAKLVSDIMKFSALTSGTGSRDMTGSVMKVR